jgi:hypothetical protein
MRRKNAVIAPKKRRFLHCDRRNAEPAARFEDADRNFAAVRNKNLAKQRRGAANVQFSRRNSAQHWDFTM